MKQIAIIGLLFTLNSSTSVSQEFDFYGPEPFGEILDNSFTKEWTPTAISEIENRKYFLILNSEKTHALTLNESDFSIGLVELSAVHGASATYSSLLRSIFQIVDINTDLANDETPLAGQYLLNPFLHKYYALNEDSDDSVIITDTGTRYISEAEKTGHVAIELSGAGNSATIKAVSKWIYDVEQDSVVEVDCWTRKWLANNANLLIWDRNELAASTFFLADANDLIDLEVDDGSAFNPISIPYSSNATAALPEIEAIEDTDIATKLMLDLDEFFHDQLGDLEGATAAASSMLDLIENTLVQYGDSLRYPKEFYLAVRENMLSQKIASSDIYGARLGYNTVPNVYFTNALDDDGVPHPYMVITSYAVSTRPNQLVDVNRPPGAQQGVGYGESTVTRDGKLGDFLIKIPLKDYGLIDNLLENDLSPYGDLATEQDPSLEKTVYNYTPLASMGVAVDGVTIYPAMNNNLRFAVQDAEVTASGIHVGGGLELHYHADGHAYTGNGINIYNISDFEGRNHPPVIGIAFDGIALFGRHEVNYSSMIGFDIDLDEYGGHDHNDGFGYHYHAHTQTVETADSPFAPEGITPPPTFEEHFLLVGAFKGRINNLPGFYELKLGQLKDNDIGRYVGGTYEAVTISSEPNPELPKTINLKQNYPNPFNPTTSITFTLPKAGETSLQIFDTLGQEIASLVNGNLEAGTHTITFDASSLSSGIYLYRLKVDNIILNKFMTLIK